MSVVDSPAIERTASKRFNMIVAYMLRLVPFWSISIPSSKSMLPSVVDFVVVR